MSLNDFKYQFSLKETILYQGLYDWPLNRNCFKYEQYIMKTVRDLRLRILSKALERGKHPTEQRAVMKEQIWRLLNQPTAFKCKCVGRTE